MASVSMGATPSAVALCCTRSLRSWLQLRNKSVLVVRRPPCGSNSRGEGFSGPDSGRWPCKALPQRCTWSILLGTELVAHLLASSKWSKVITIGRSTLNDALVNKAPEGKLQQLKINMDNMSAEAGAAFQGADTVFCTLGTTRAAAGSAAGFKKVDLEWVAEAAKLAKQNGVPHFSLLTAQGAAPKLWASNFIAFSGLLYLKTKGQAEEAAKAQGFDSLSIFRPGLIDRGDRARAVEKLASGLVKAIKVADLGKLMALDAEALHAGDSKTCALAVFEMKALMAAAKAGTAPQR